MSNPLGTQVDGNHYKTLAVQPVEYIHANRIGYFEGNVIKYVTRWKSKNGIKDLEKAKHYIDLLIQLETEVSGGAYKPDPDWDKGEQRIDTIAASAGDGEHYNTTVLALHADAAIPEHMQYISVHQNGQAAAHVNRPELVPDGADLCWHPKGENTYLGVFEDAEFGLYQLFGEHWLLIEGLE